MRQLLAIPLVFMCLALLLPRFVLAQNAPTPEPLQKVEFEQNLGAQVDPGLAFTDSDSQPVRLRDYFGDKPIILTLAYYECPMLCKVTLDGVTRALQELPFDAGEDYHWIVASINPEETPQQAQKKKATMAARYAHAGAQRGWHYLVGDRASSHTLADTVGFRYTYDERTGQYAHPAGVVVLTPDGRVSKYFFGTGFDPADLRLGLVDASGGTIGSATDQLLLRCYQYDPSTGQYGFAVMAAVRIGGVIGFLGLLTLIGTLLWREKRSRRQQPASS